jgi:hypothetical protein
MKRLPTTNLSAPVFADLTALPAVASLLERAQHFSRLGEQIKEALPTALRDHVRFAKLQNGQICFLADSSTWAAKLRLLSYVVITEAKRLGFADVKELHIRVGR